MTAQDLIKALQSFHPSDEVEIVISRPVFEDVTGDVDRVESNNGQRRRILIKSNELSQ